jgi:uncharacterized Zn finger protein
MDSTIKSTPIDHCQICERDFAPQEIVHFVPSDYIVVCSECGKSLHEKAGIEHLFENMRIFIKR